jgi:hypothetical protein
MAANWELQLLSAIVRGPSSPELWEQAQKLGLSFKMFSSIEVKQVWSFVDKHYRRPHNFGHIPSIQTLTEQFSYLDLPEPLENFDDLCDKVRVGYLRRMAENAVKDYVDNVSVEPVIAIAKLHGELGEIQERVSVEKDIDFNETALRDTLEEMQSIEESEGLTGMPWPWSRLNIATGGIQDGDFIMVWALPKSMKTWFGLIIAAHLYSTGRRVLIYSKEMTAKAMRRRVACILAKINYTKYKEGTLSTSEVAHLLDTLEHLADGETGRLWFTQADRHDGLPGGPADIRRKIDVYRPHFVLLDSAYMLELPNAGSQALDWKQLSLVNRQLKQISKVTGVAILAVLQENERSAIKYTKSRGTASLAMNTGAVMDCDIGLRLVYHRKKQELSIHFAAARETTYAGFTINALCAENFEYAHDTLYGVGDDYKDEPEVQEEQPRLGTSPIMEMHRRSNETDEIEEDLQEDEQG